MQKQIFGMPLLIYILTRAIAVGLILAGFSLSYVLADIGPWALMAWIVIPLRIILWLLVAVVAWNIVQNVIIRVMLLLR